MQTVARELGCDYALVDYYMRKYQIPRRGISEARRLQSNHFRDVEIKEAKRIQNWIRAPMKKQIGKILIDVRERSICLTWKQFEVICEALHGLDLRSGKTREQVRKERLKVARELVGKWKEKDASF